MIVTTTIRNEFSKKLLLLTEHKPCLVNCHQAKKNMIHLYYCCNFFDTADTISNWMSALVIAAQRHFILGWNAIRDTKLLIHCKHKLFTLLLWSAAIVIFYSNIQFHFIQAFPSVKTKQIQVKFQNSSFWRIKHVAQLTFKYTSKQRHSSLISCWP